MKTMKLNNNIVRVKEKDVDHHLDMGYKYTTKKDWKVNVRDFEKPKKEKKEKEEDK